METESRLACRGRILRLAGSRAAALEIGTAFGRLLRGLVSQKGITCRRRLVTGRKGLKVSFMAASSRP